MPRRNRHRTTTDEPTLTKGARVVTAFQDPRNHTRSNYDLAIELNVDESTVRKYRRLLRIPKLQPGSGEPEEELPKKGRKKK
jgi:hypothetical protein